MSSDIIAQNLARKALRRFPRFTHYHAFGNSYVQGAGSDGGVLAGGGGFAGKTAEALDLVDWQFSNHAIGGSSVGLDQGAVGNCGYATGLAAFRRADLTATLTAATAGPRTYSDPTIEPTINIPVTAALTAWPFGTGLLETATGRKIRAGGFDTTPRFTFVLDVDEQLAASSTLRLRATKRQGKRWGQWPGGERRLVTIGPFHDWLGIGDAAVAPMIQGYRTLICRALAANIIAGDGDSFNAGAGLNTQATTIGGSAAGSGTNWYTPTATDGSSYMEVTVPGDAVGCPLVFGFSLRNGQTATWRISVNGTDHGDCVLTPGHTANRYSGSVYRVPAADLPKGAVVRARCVAQSATGVGPIDYISIEARTPTTPVIVLGTTRYPGDNNANDARVATINAQLQAMVAEFERPSGINPARFVNADAVLGNAAENFFTDDQHPSELGHSRLASATLNEIRAWATATGR